jgi:hypothetical protein
MKLSGAGLSIVLVFLIVSCVGCTETTKSNKDLIQGRWINESYGGDSRISVAYEFYDDGTLIVDFYKVDSSVHFSGPRKMDLLYDFMGDSAFRISIPDELMQQYSSDLDSSVLYKMKIISLDNEKLILEDLDYGEQLYLTRDV